MLGKKIGVTIAGGALLASCGFRSSPEIITRAEQELPLLETPYSNPDEAITTIRVDENIYVTCYDSSVAIGVDHVRANVYKNGGYFLSGYVQVQDRPEGPNGPVIDTLSTPSINLSNNLPSC